MTALIKHAIEELEADLASCPPTPFGRAMALAIRRRITALEEGLTHERA